MSEISKYEAQKKKMQDLCEEHGLTYRLYKDTYPITLVVRPASGMDEQLSMLEDEKAAYISPDAIMRWAYKEGTLETTVKGGTFTMSKTLRSKIENILLKMISYWQQYFFREVVEKGLIAKGRMPVIDEDEAEDDDTDPEDEDGEKPGDEGEEEMIAADDPLVQQAIQAVRAENKATVSLLQRRLNLGYSKAARLMDTLEELGIVGPYNGSDPREVLVADPPEDIED